MIHVASGVLVLGFFIYYAAGETRLLAHRHLALPKIAAKFARYPELPVYAYRDIDPRAVYYGGKAIEVLKADVLKMKLQAKESLLLFVEDEIPQQATQQMCRLAVFSPYLRTGHSATIFGSGTACR
jgi:hypothetical protein